MAVKYIFITGGVVSSLGKGITAASLGRLFKSRGYKVSMMKFDPYINTDPGLMSPYQHGEVFVTQDGAQTDLDIGHYERFIDENLTHHANVTAGKIYFTVINRERRGEYRGGTVQVIPHIINEIKRRIHIVSKQEIAPDVVITEIGGTVGDIESQPFLETIRQFKAEAGPNNCLFVHVTLLPYLDKAGELKTKPTQHSVKELRSIGIQPDIIVCRSEQPIAKALRDKIGLFCGVDGSHVVANTDAPSIYEVPLMLEAEGLAKLACHHLHLENDTVDLSEWEALTKAKKNIKETVRIALVGAYVELHDVYLSTLEALDHAGVANNVNVEIEWVKSSDIKTMEDAHERLSRVDGVIVPAGYDDRGLEGMIKAIQYAREKQIPFLGVCLGMQMCAVEFARNVLGFEQANTTESAEDTTCPIIDLMDEQKEDDDCDIMRLGNYACTPRKGSKLHEIFGKDIVHERHRHSYEFNNAYRQDFEDAGMIASGVNERYNLVEAMELKDHPFFVGVQFRPEFASRLNRPHPLFIAFLGACRK